MNFEQSARLSGEISQLEIGLSTLENDLAEYKDINKRYRDQLIKVKVCVAYSALRRLAGGRNFANVVSDVRYG